MSADRCNKAHKPLDGWLPLEFMNKGDHLFRGIALQPGMVGILAELLGDFIVAHRVCRASLAEIGFAMDDAAIVQSDVDDRGHLVVAGLFSLLVDDEIDL